MMKQKLFFLGCCLSLVFCSCQKPASQENKLTSISGEIANPQSSYLVLLHHNRVIDTVLLDQNNRFFYYFKDSVASGLYKLAHNYGHYDETQMFYMRPGDAIRLRLNTRDFDQSLMYSGSQAAANNFLMHLFLEFRRENKSILTHYYTLTPQQFVQKIDSIQGKRSEELTQLYAQKAISKAFYDLGRQIIAYAKNDWHERYYFLINKYMPDLKAQLPKAFLSYRQKADYNQKTIQTYYLYQYFIRDYLKNLSVLRCQKLRRGADCFDLRSRANLVARIKMADSLFQLKSLRVRFLAQFGSELIMESETAAQVDEVTRFLDSIAFDSVANRNLHQLAEVQKYQFIGDISSLGLVTPQGETLSMMQVLHKPTIIYYWSIYYKPLHLSMHREIAKLRNRYPELDFVGINIDNNERDLWKSSLINFGYTGDEYQLICPPGLSTFYTNYLDRLFFVSAEGKIVSGKLHLVDPRLEEEILGLLNR